MKCPDLKQWDLLAMGVLDPDREEPLLEHARSCPACRERYQDARRAHTERLRMYDAFDCDHDRLREQLMAALPADGPPRVAEARFRRGWHRLGGLAMRLNTRAGRIAAVVLAPAACILLAVAVFLSPGQHSAFAAALERMREADTIVGRFRAFLNDADEPTQSGTMYLSAAHGSRFDSASSVSDQADMTIYNRPQGLVVMVSPALGGVMRMHMPQDDAPDAFGWDWQQRSPAGFIRSFLRLVGEADRQLGRTTIEGREAEGFEVDGRRLGLAFAGSAPGSGLPAEETPEPAVRLWVDVETNLPLRMEVETFQQGGPLGITHLLAVFDRFQWDVPLHAGFFEPQIPDDARIIDVDVPPLNEQTLLNGLRLYADALGHYPPVLDAARIAAEYAMTLAVQGKIQFDAGSPLASFSADFMREAITLGRAVVFCQRLARDGREPEYFGDVVTPDDGDAVLLRWRLGDGRVRVIYGDLRAETVAAPG